MFQQLLKILSAPDANPPKPDDLRIAVAVLLVEAASMDAEFDAGERGTIEHLLTQKFGLSQQETTNLLGVAESVVKRSAQLHPFTRTTVSRMSRAERIHLIEMLWEVAYTDGELNPEEDALLRRVAGLIYVSDADRVGARRHVLERLGKNKT